MEVRLKLVNNSGLRSESNLCFANSAIQMLHNIPRIRSFFLEKEYNLPNEKKQNMGICDELAQIFQVGVQTVTSAAKLRKMVGESASKPYLMDGSQQDVLDFLFTLLDTIEKELSDQNWEAKVLIREFWGREKIEKKFLDNNSGKCSRCKLNPRVEEESFNYLQLNVPDTMTVIPLSRMLDNHFSESSNTFQMKCSNCCPHNLHCPGTGQCKQRNTASQRVLVVGSDILVVQLNRFSREGNVKIKTTVWPDEKLTMKTGEEYQLNSIAHHLGESKHSGHYLVSFKEDGTWFRCNDAIASLSSESEAKSEESYICVYLKVVNQSTPFTPTDEWQDIKGRQVPGLLHYSMGIRGNYARKLFKEGINSADKVSTSKLSADDTNLRCPKPNLGESGKQAPIKCKNCGKEYMNIQQHFKEAMICGQTESLNINKKKCKKKDKILIKTKKI